MGGRKGKGKIILYSNLKREEEKRKNKNIGITRDSFLELIECEGFVIVFFSNLKKTLLL